MGTVLETLDVTTPGRDIWRPAIARNLDNQVAIVWSENRTGNFDLYSRLYIPQKKEFSTEARAHDESGGRHRRIARGILYRSRWMAWQSWENGRAFIRLGTAFGEFRRIRRSSARGNAWSPSLAIDREGNIAVAYDTYEAGNYDVRFTRFDAEGKLRKTMIVANSPRYEARPTVAFDPNGRA